jgi:hypothetical protein
MPITSYAAVNKISNADWEEASKSTNLPVAELQKRYQDFVSQNPDLLNQQQVAGVPVANVEPGSGKALDKTFGFNIWIVSFKVHVRGHFSSFQDFDLRWTCKGSVFGFEFSSEERRLSPQNSYATIGLSAGFVSAQLTVGVRAHGGHADLYAKGAVTYFGTTKEEEIVLIHFGS